MAITHKRSFEFWIEENSSFFERHDITALAQRASARAFPYWCRALRSDWAQYHNLTAVPVARSLISTSVSSRLSARILSAANSSAAVAASHASHALNSIGSNTGSIEPASADDAATAASIASEHAADSASAAAHASAAAGTSFWLELDQDLQTLEQQGRSSLMQMPLWSNSNAMPGGVRLVWSQARTALHELSGHSFWIKWYETLLEGRPLKRDWGSHWRLIENIALIDESDWVKDASQLEQIISQLENETTSKTIGSKILPNKFEPALPEIKSGLSVNRETIPRCLDTLHSHIDIEIRRLQGINDWSFDAAQENAREISARLTRMAAIVQDLKLRIDEIGAEPTIADAEESRRLWQLYVDEIRGWPEENVKEIVDSTWRLGLCGLTGGALTMFGVAAPVAFGAAGVFFGGKKVIDAVKDARSNPKS